MKNAPNSHGAASKGSFVFTKITATNPCTLAKTYSLAPDGNLQKRTAASMMAGHAERNTVGNVAEFAEVLQSLTTSQALVYGATEQARANITTKAVLPNAPTGTITRTKSYFSWPSGGGVLMLDHDASTRQTFDRTGLIDALHRAAPSLSDAGFVWWPSSSSHIHNTDTDLSGLQGQRLYFLVKNAADIERAGRVLGDRLWLAGFGWYDVSKAGSLLERTIFDLSVWQPTRFDFAAGAHCLEPLTQRRGEPFVQDGAVLDTRQALPDLSLEERAELDRLKNQARQVVRPDQEARQAEFTQRITQVIGDDGRAARRALDGILMGDYPLILDNGQKVTVGECMDDATTYHGRLTLDPLEPDYENGKIVGKLFLIAGRAKQHSMAHGGRTYRLIRQPQNLQLIGGDDHGTVQKILTMLRQLPDVFDFGDQLVTISDGRLVRLDSVDLLRHWLGGFLQCYVTKKTPQGMEYPHNENPPLSVCKALIALGSGRKLKPLDGVITAPTILPDGTLLNIPGYHAQSRLFLDCDELQPIPARPTSEDAIRAVNLLMRPFSDFPFCTPLDRSVMLTASLTAAVRPALPTSPAFGFDAPVQGSGKTLLAQCAAAQSTGTTPTVWPPTDGRDDEETRKRLFTTLLAGDRALVWDNVLGTFDSASLAAFLSSATFTDRILGKSQSTTLPNKVLFLITGNNLELAGDMPRRVLVCRIDPRTDRPFARRFDVDPLRYVINHRQQLVSAALTVIRAFLQSGAPKATGRMASFEAWDDLVRQPVAWLASMMPELFDDPMKAIDLATSRDPDAESWSEVLICLQDKYGLDTPFSAGQIANDFAFIPRADLTEALEAIIPGKSTNARSIGRAFRYREGRRVTGLYLDPLPKKDGSSRWRVRESGG